MWIVVAPILGAVLAPVAAEILRDLYRHRRRRTRSVPRVRDADPKTGHDKPGESSMPDR